MASADAAPSGELCSTTYEQERKADVTLPPFGRLNIPYVQANGVGYHFPKTLPSWDERLACHSACLCFWPEKHVRVVVGTSGNQYRGDYHAYHIS